MSGIGEFVGCDDMCWAPVVTSMWKGSGWMDGWMDAVCELVMGHNAAESVSQC